MNLRVNAVMTVTIRRARRRRSAAAIVLARRSSSARRHRTALPRRSRLHHSRRRSARARRPRSRRGGASAFTRDPEFSVPTRGGDIPARFYRPARQTARTLVLIPGVHRDGIDESRLVGLAEDLAATGYRRADHRRAGPAALQDHAAGHRRDRRRRALGQRPAAVPHRRQDRHRRHQLFRRPLDRRRRAASRSAIAWRS